MLIEKAIGASATVAASAAFVAAAEACCKHWTKTKAAACDPAIRESFYNTLHIADAERYKFSAPQPQILRQA